MVKDNGRVPPDQAGQASPSGDHPSRKACLTWSFNAVNEMAALGIIKNAVATRAAYLGSLMDILEPAIATEAGTAETLKDGSVHDGAGLQGIAQDAPAQPPSGESQ